jgi:hypothetical protein
VQHVGMRAISEILPKFMNLESLAPELRHHINVDEIRQRMLKGIFSQIDLFDDTEKINNLISTLTELFENKALLELTVSNKEALEYLFNALSRNVNAESKDTNYNYSEALVILIHLIKFSSIENLKLPYYRQTDEADTVQVEENKGEIQMTVLGELILRNLDVILDNFIIPNIFGEESGNQEGTYGMNFRPLGMKR